MGEHVIICLGTREYTIELSNGVAQVNGISVLASDVSVDGHSGVVIQSGERTLRAVLDAGAEEGYVLFRGREFAVRFETQRHRLLKRLASSGAAGHGHADLRASMPGMVVRVIATPGSEVKKGQAVLILEAMKMENEIRAPIDGTVNKILVKHGQAVEKGDLLMVLG